MLWVAPDVKRLFEDRVEVFESFFSVVLIKILDAIGWIRNVLQF